MSACEHEGVKCPGCGHPLDLHGPVGIGCAHDADAPAGMTEPEFPRAYGVCPCKVEPEGVSA